MLRPDTYIGSVEMYQQELWVYDKDTDKIVFKRVSYVPGLYKIFGKYRESINFCAKSRFLQNFVLIQAQ